MALTNNAISIGSVSQAFGATGLLQTLLDFIIGTEVTGAATSGSGSGPYTATLANTPVGLGRTVINYAFSAVNYTAQDDGSGNITGTNVSSGSINHQTGALTITFTGTPDAAPTVDYLYGEPGQDWRLLEKRNSTDNTFPAAGEPFGSTCFECFIHNTGLSGSENVLLGFREWFYAASAAYGIELTGYLTYLAGQKWQSSIEDMNQANYDSTWEHWSEAPFLPIIDDTMYYWFYSNQQRIVLSVKANARYESSYVGFANRYGNPVDYPYPLAVVGGAYGNVTTNTNVGETHHFIPWSASTGSDAMHNLLPDNSWSVNWDNNSGLTCTWLYPFANWSNYGQIYETPEKKEALMSPVIGYNVNSVQTLWELDGVYHVAGVGVQSEDMINASDGIKYRVFQNISDADYNDFMCVAEEDYTSTSTSTTTSSSTTTTS